jgi:hypothetical protein
VTPEDFKFFRVEVSDHAGTIVSIESGMLNGREIGPSEEAKIREAIEHLQGFVGSGVDQPCWGCGTDNELHRAGCPMMAEQTTAVETSERRKDDDIVRSLLQSARTMLNTVAECGTHTCEDCRTHAGIHRNTIDAYLRSIE